MLQATHSFTNRTEVQYSYIIIPVFSTIEWNPMAQSIGILEQAVEHVSVRHVTRHSQPSKHPK